MRFPRRHRRAPGPGGAASPPHPRPAAGHGAAAETKIEAGADAARDAGVLADIAASALLTGSAGPARRIADAAGTAIAVLDSECRWRYVNAAFVRVAGPAAADELLGIPIEDTALAAAAVVVRAVLADGRTRDHALAADAGTVLRFRRLPATAADPRTTVSASPHPAVLAVLLPAPQRQPGADQPREHPADPEPHPHPAPHRRHDAEHTHARPRDTPSATTDDAHLRRLTLLAAVAERVGSTLDVAATCAELADITVPALGIVATVEILPAGTAETAEHGSARPAGPPHLQRSGAALAAHVGPLELPCHAVRYPRDSPVAVCLRSGEPVAVYPRTDEELRSVAPDSATLEVFRSAGVRAVLAVPLVAHRRTVGVLVLGRGGESPGGFGADDVRTARDVAAGAAVAIDHARRYTRAQGIALELQQALLTEPGKPHTNLELAWRYLPSGTASVVGGDWYEVVRLSFGRTLLVIGDVMGHGVEAAVDMSNYRATLRYVAAMDLPPHRILRRLDALISEDDAARPATCLLALADPNRARWTVSSAGHLPPALVSAAGPTRLLDVPTGPPLGTGVGGYEQTTHELVPDETLLLYTDGLVERRDQDIDVSLAGLTALRLPGGGPLDALLASVLTRLAPHTAEDDIALLAARARTR
ncbi:GAF domain-containing SpoIIE family protein phosphatase [Yinghuangia aomiensis]